MISGGIVCTQAAFVFFVDLYNYFLAEHELCKFFKSPVNFSCWWWKRADCALICGLVCLGMSIAHATMLCLFRALVCVLLNLGESLCLPKSYRRILPWRWSRYSAGGSCLTRHLFILKARVWVYRQMWQTRAHRAHPRWETLVQQHDLVDPTKSWLCN